MPSRDTVVLFFDTAAKAAAATHLYTTVRNPPYRLVAAIQTAAASFACFEGVAYPPPAGTSPHKDDVALGANSPEQVVHVLVFDR